MNALSNAERWSARLPEPPPYSEVPIRGIEQVPTRPLDSAPLGSRAPIGMPVYTESPGPGEQTLFANPSNRKP